ncbi:MAG: transcriptional regulator/sugar kinase [uncultured archaeon A07HR60]|nr:MAG: transcriptional regulator/sugar kinase [uncultured archaeon A07HR60]
MKTVLGIDIGATKIRATVSGDDLRITDPVVKRSPAVADPDVFTAELATLVERACSEAGLTPAAISAVGVGSAGPIKRTPEAVLNPPNLPVDNLPIERAVRAAVDTDQVRVLNDAVCGAVAEHEFAGGGTDDMVYLTVSTGLGAGVIVDGRPLGGNTGEVGHLTVDPGMTMECGCGGAGHWEAYCSGVNLPRYARHLSQHGDHGTALSTDGTLSAADIFAAAPDDELAAATLAQFDHWNLIGLADVVHAFAPSYVALGGSVVLHNRDRVLTPLRERLSDHVMVDPPAIGVTEFGDEIVLKGALAVAADQVSPGASPSPQL